MRASDSSTEEFLKGAERGDVEALEMWYQKCIEEHIAASGEENAEETAGLTVDSVVDKATLQGGWHVAAATGAIVSLEWLKDNGGGIDVADKDGCTAAHFAAAEGHIAVLEWLKINHHSLDVSDHHGLSPCDYSNMTGHEEASAWMQACSGSGGARMFSGCAALFSTDPLSPSVWRAACQVLHDASLLTQADPVPWGTLPLERSLVVLSSASVRVVGRMLTIGGEFQLCGHPFCPIPAFTGCDISAEDLQGDGSRGPISTSMSMVQYRDTQNSLMLQCFVPVKQEVLEREILHEQSEAQRHDKGASFLPANVLLAKRRLLRWKRESRSSEGGDGVDLYHSVAAAVEAVQRTAQNRRRAAWGAPPLQLPSLLKRAPRAPVSRQHQRKCLLRLVPLHPTKRRQTKSASITTPAAPQPDLLAGCLSSSLSFAQTHVAEYERMLLQVMPQRAPRHVAGAEAAGLARYAPYVRSLMQATALPQLVRCTRVIRQFLQHLHKGSDVVSIFRKFCSSVRMMQRFVRCALSKVRLQEVLVVKQWEQREMTAVSSAQDRLHRERRHSRVTAAFHDLKALESNTRAKKLQVVRELWEERKADFRQRHSEWRRSGRVGREPSFYGTVTVAEAVRHNARRKSSSHQLLSRGPSPPKRLSSKVLSPKGSFERRSSKAMSPKGSFERPSLKGSFKRQSLKGPPERLSSKASFSGLRIRSSADSTSSPAGSPKMYGSRRLHRHTQYLHLPHWNVSVDTGVGTTWIEKDWNVVEQDLDRDITTYSSDDDDEQLPVAPPLGPPPARRWRKSDA